MSEDKQKNRISIAFVLPHMEIGGVGRSLLSLLDILHQYDDLEVHILLFRMTGGLLQQIPSWVHVEHVRGMEGQEKIRASASWLLRQKGLGMLFDPAKKLYHHLGLRRRSKSHRTYDIAVGYQDGAPTWYVVQNVDAVKKVAFIHTDFQKAMYNADQERSVYMHLDQIYCVSMGARESFLQVLPEFWAKTQVFQNIINLDRIRKLSCDGISFQDDFTGIRILTVGRLSHEKDLEKAMRVLEKLLDDRHKVKWYVIGQGPEENNLKALAKEMKVEKDFIFLGSMENPYGYMAKCDIYVQPSNYEGYSIAVAEARALFKPIVACDFAGARDQLVSEVNGLICSLKEEDLYSELKKLVTNGELRACFTLNLEKQAETTFRLNQAVLDDFLLIQKPFT